MMDDLDRVAVSGVVSWAKQNLPKDWKVSEIHGSDEHKVITIEMLNPYQHPSGTNKIYVSLQISFGTDSWAWAPTPYFTLVHEINEMKSSTKCNINNIKTLNEERDRLRGIVTRLEADLKEVRTPDLQKQKDLQNKVKGLTQALKSSKSENEVLKKRLILSQNDLSDLYEKASKGLVTSDMHQFIRMLLSAGYRYEVGFLQSAYFLVGGESKEVQLRCITVQGTFYDELYVYFNEAGELVEMQSHVAWNSPASLKLKKMIKDSEEK